MEKVYKYKYNGNKRVSGKDYFYISKDCYDILNKYGNFNLERVNPIGPHICPGFWKTTRRTTEDEQKNMNIPDFSSFILCIADESSDALIIRNTRESIKINLSKGVTKSEAITTEYDSITADIFTEDGSKNIHEYDEFGELLKIIDALPLWNYKESRVEGESEDRISIEIKHRDT